MQAEEKGPAERVLLALRMANHITSLEERTLCLAAILGLGGHFLNTEQEKEGPSMSVPADEVYKVIQQLSPSDRKTVYDLAQYLRDRHHAAIKAWRDIDDQEPDPEPLSPEESEQLTDPDFMSRDGESNRHGV